MTKPKSQFAALSEEDRRHILDLCTHHPYDQVVAILARSRPEGLGILTSKSALCRFFTHSLHDPDRIVLAQRAAAAQIQHELHSNAFLAAIRASIEARVYENLLGGKALADMEKDFRLLKTAESLYLADAKWRTDNPKAVRAAYQSLVEQSASSSDPDFIPVSEQPPTPAPELSPFDEDLAAAREKQRVETEHRQQLLEKLKSAGFGPHPVTPEPRGNKPVAPAPRPEHPVSTPIAAKSPVIPHIPPNSTSPYPVPPVSAVPSAASPCDPSASQPSPSPSPTKRAPFIRPSPRINRNDPCPCGSGLKHKKCCLSKTSLPLAA